MIASPTQDKNRHPSVLIPRLEPWYRFGDRRSNGRKVRIQKYSPVKWCNAGQQISPHIGQKDLRRFCEISKFHPNKHWNWWQGLLAGGLVMSFEGGTQRTSRRGLPSWCKHVLRAARGVTVMRTYLWSFGKTIAYVVIALPEGSLRLR